MFLAGPFALRLAFHGFVVLVGVLILSGAVNTAIIGSNGVLSRVAEDGVLPPWFRKLHPKHGTAHHIINTIVGLQLLTILLSRGDVNMLGEAYAFGVVWSFAMKGLAVVVLRFTHPEAKRWKFPLNISVGGFELPLGLIATTAILLMMAIVNLFTKKAATISGGIFTVVFFVIFTFSERKYAGQQAASKIQSNQDLDDPFRETSRERFRLQAGENLSWESLQVRPGCAVVGVEEPGDLRALETVLASDISNAQDVVVICVRDSAMGDAEDDAGHLIPESLVDDHVTDVLSEVVFSAEKAGKPVKLLVLSGDNTALTLLTASVALHASDLWLGSSRDRTPDQLRADLESSWKTMATDQQSLNISLVFKQQVAPKRLCLVT
jgi:Amino acid permease